MSAKPSRSNSASVSRSDPSKTTQVLEPSEMSVVPKEIISVIDSLKQQVEAQRHAIIKNDHIMVAPLKYHGRKQAKIV
ncbi:Chromosomal replication initiator protein DnaA [Bienertia sinuspersici]